MAVRKKKKTTRKMKKISRVINFKKTITIEVPDGVEADLPKILRFGDYHDAEIFREQLANIIPKIKYRELGLAYSKYVTIFYTTKDVEYKKMVKQAEKDIENWWANNA